jgi:hypothetical protein
MPTSTDLVTDLPADFEVFGQAVDTRLKALQPGTTLGDLAYSSATANTNTRLPIGTSGQVLAVSGGGVPAWTTTSDVTPLTTKGDLFTFTTVDARIGVGANGTVLTADSAEATGLKWATPAAGGQTSIASGSLTGSSVTLSSISSAYRDLKLVITNFRPSADLKLMMRFNGATSGYRATPGTYTASVTFADTELFISTTADGGASSQSLIVVDIPEYANTVAWKMMTYNSLVNNETTNTNGAWEQNTGLYKSTSAISSITLLPQAGGTFTTGDYVLYGVK